MNTIEYRNLAEQVEKNKQDILKHFQRDEILADFGIRIIGQVETPAELPETAAEYGDAYAVGTQSPFNYFIWTRANNLSPVDYWFDFGEIAIAGPQGPKGDRGEKGATGESTYWISIFTLNYLDLEEQDIPLGTMVLEYGTGDVYQVQIVNKVKMFNYQMNIRGAVGPQGPKGDKGDKGDKGERGPQGPQGDVGGFINIAGVLANEEELPAPYQINNLTVAYLVGEDKDLYIQIGRTSGTAQWANMGPLNVSTMVTVDGQYQNTWDADTKVNKIPLSQVSGSLVYIRDHLGNDDYRTLSASPLGGAIPIYNRSSTNQGVLKTGTPESDNDCANKAYVDSNRAWQEMSGSYNYIYGSQSIYFDDSLRGHVISIVLKIAHRDFSDWAKKLTTISQPTLIRLPARGLPSFNTQTTVVSNGDNFKNVTIAFAVGDFSAADYDPICSANFSITNPDGADFQSPTLVVEYQDLGLMPEPQG